MTFNELKAALHGDTIEILGEDLDSFSRVDAQELDELAEDYRRTAGSSVLPMWAQDIGRSGLGAVADNFEWAADRIRLRLRCEEAAW